MDNQMRFGSGSPLLGGTSALNKALASRGVDASVLQQVGGSSPTAMPPTGDLQNPANAMPANPSLQSPLPNGTPEAELILKALSERLRSDSKIKEAQAIPSKPTFM